MPRYRCVLLTSDRPDLADGAEACARGLFQVQHVSRHARSERRFPDAAARVIDGGGVDFLLNYLAPMLVPARVLDAVERDSINFHPAPPAWPGIGSASFALYHEDAAFGVTAHRMTPAIDAGEIVRTSSVPIYPHDGCEALFERALLATLPLFREVCAELASAGEIPASGQQWARPAITRAEFERWMTVRPTDPPAEVARKVRALRHSRFPGPFYEIDGVRVPVPVALGSDIR